MIETKKYGGFKVSLEDQNFDPSDVQKIRYAAEHMAKAIGSEEFKDFVRNYKYQVTYYSRWWRRSRKVVQSGMRYNEGKSQEDILQHLLSGAETLSPEIDREADVTLILDKKYTKGVLGYTYANTTKQWIYNWFFKSGSVKDVAGNIAHEWCHKMGYGHEYNYNSKRQHTVPYAVGYFVRDYMDINI